MQFAELIIFIPGPPILSIFVWVGLIVGLLYFAREPAHRALHSFGWTIYSGFRMSARSVLLAEKRLAARNKEVLLEASRDSLERIIDREFHRVDAVVKRDLSGYPTLQRSLTDQIAQIDEDYRQSSEPSPPPPTWVHAVEAVAKIPANGDPTVVQVLDKIKVIINDQYKNTMAEYRKVSPPAMPT